MINWCLAACNEQCTFPTTMACWAPGVLDFLFCWSIRIRFPFSAKRINFSLYPIHISNKNVIMLFHIQIGISQESQFGSLGKMEPVDSSNSFASSFLLSSSHLINRKSLIKFLLRGSMIMMTVIQLNQPTNQSSPEVHQSCPTGPAVQSVDVRTALTECHYHNQVAS